MSELSDVSEIAAKAELDDKTYTHEQIAEIVPHTLGLIQKHREVEATLFKLITALAQRVVLPKDANIRTDRFYNSCSVMLWPFVLVYRKEDRDDLLRKIDGETNKKLIPIGVIVHPRRDHGTFVAIWRGKFVGEYPTQKRAWTEISQHENRYRYRYR